MISGFANHVASSIRHKAYLNDRDYFPDTVCHRHLLDTRRKPGDFTGRKGAVVDAKLVNKSGERPTAGPGGSNQQRSRIFSTQNEIGTDGSLHAIDIDPGRR